MMVLIVEVDPSLSLKLVFFIQSMAVPIVVAEFVEEVEVEESVMLKELEYIQVHMMAMVV